MPPALSEKLQYPIGRFSFHPVMTEKELHQCIERISSLPARLREQMNLMDAGQWDTPYRPGGWTVRQVVHHLADSHANAFIRFKLALTEDNPTIKPYMEERWAELPDTSDVSPLVSVQFLEALHARWAVLLRSMQPADWQKTVFHPERERNITLWEMLTLYAWHGDHHLGHIGLVMETSGYDHRKNH